jgi:hypothetical protein
MKSLRQLSPNFVKKSRSANSGYVSNEVLYKLCKDHPRHDIDAIVIAKVMMIGRVYAAAIERGRESAGAGGDDFYETKVAPIIRRSPIDKWLEALDRRQNDMGSDDEEMALNVKTHKRVMTLFHKISRKGRTSLASKYLHFHSRKRFYIFDSRAAWSISQLTKPMRRTLPHLREHDKVYAGFCLRCHDLNKRITGPRGRLLLPRELDNVLTAYHRKYFRKT